MRDAINGVANSMNHTANSLTRSANLKCVQIASRLKHNMYNRLLTDAAILRMTQQINRCNEHVKQSRGKSLKALANNALALLCSLDTCSRDHSKSQQSYHYITLIYCGRRIHSIIILRNNDHF